MYHNTGQLGIYPRLLMLFEEGPKFLALSGIIWGRAMPLSLLENTDWAAKAEDARKMALNERDPEIKTWLTGIVRGHWPVLTLSGLF